MTNRTALDRPADPHLTNFTVLLQANPGQYLGFGWLWWAVKAALKTRVSAEELYLLGPSNEPALVQLALDTYADTPGVILAAIDHFQERAYLGHLRSPDDHLPDGAPYRLEDPDAGWVNA